MGLFLYMSIALMSWAYDQQLPALHKFVLVTIADHCGNETGECYPSVARIARRTGMSERSVQRCLRDLEGAEVLSKRYDGKRTPIYKLNHNLPIVINKADYSAPSWLRPAAIKVYNETCYWCQDKGTDKNGPDGKPWSLDRLVPGRKGGKYEPDNVVLCCCKCNSLKRELLPAEFCEHLGIEQPDLANWDGCLLDTSKGDRQTPPPVSISHPNHKYEPSVEPPPIILLSEKAKKPESTRASKIAAVRYRVCRVWGRATATRWDKKEEDILPTLLDTSEEDWLFLTDYYSHRGEPGYYCRKSLITLLNNWAGEIDKARNHGMEETPQYKLPNL
jgi:helix-turn-helix protein